MSDLKITPAPWLCDPDHGTVNIGGYLSDSGWPFVLIASVYPCDVGQDVERAANTHLIAAAPELYDAVNGLIGLLQLITRRGDVPAALHNDVFTNARFDAAVLALAKARGETERRAYPVAQAYRLAARLGPAAAVELPADCEPTA